MRQDSNVFTNQKLTVHSFDNISIVATAGIYKTQIQMIL